MSRTRTPASLGPPPVRWCSRWWRSDRMPGTASTKRWSWSTNGGLPGEGPQRVQLRALQLAAGGVRQQRDDRRGDEVGDPEEPDLPLVREADRDEDAVGRAGDEDHRHPREEAGADGGAQRVVARAVEQLVAPAVARDEALLEPRPQVQQPEADAREQQPAEERVGDPRVAREARLERRHRA